MAHADERSCVSNSCGGDDGSSGLLLQRVHFVAAGTAVPSRGPGRSRNPASSSFPAPKFLELEPAPGTGSLASNPAVAKMMRLMNYKEGSGLGKHDQGITYPIQVTLRPKNAGLGTVEGSYNNGLGTDLGTAEGSPRAPSDDADIWVPRLDNWREPDDAREAWRRPDLEFYEQILARLRELRAADAAAAQMKKAPGTLAVIAKAMTLVHKESASGKFTPVDLICEFTRLKEKFPEEYKTYCLADTAVALAAPLLRPVFQRWAPLWDPELWLEVARLLKNMLDDDSSATSPYAVLVNDIVVPAVQASVWDAREPAPLVRFLKTWEDALPPSAVQCILEQMVIPKLGTLVESWLPQWEPYCHIWLRPWVPLLGQFLESLYRTIYHKLEEAEASVDMVSPLKDVFSPASWEDLVNQYVVPKVRRMLRELQVTPPKQKDGTTFRIVMAWAPLVRARDMVPLLEDEFFGKWLGTLHHWLRAARPSTGEAVAWYEGWKRLFTPELLAEESVREQLKAGLGMINRAAQPRQDAEAHACVPSAGAMS